MAALKLKDFESKNKCTREERALQRAEEAVPQHQADMKQWSTSAKEMNAQMEAIANSTHVTTMQEPDFGELTPVTADMTNYESMNQSANKLTVATKASKMNARDLENAGTAQMDDSRPTLMMLLI